MAWDVTAAIAEIVGALAVVASVIYLAMQVKRQTQESSLAATREIAVQNQSAIEILLADPNLLSLYGRAVQNYNDLPDSERLWAALFFQRGFRGSFVQRSVSCSHQSTLNRGQS